LSIDTHAAFAMSDGRGSFHLSPAPEGAKQAMAAQFLNYDNDACWILVALTSKGLRLWRNVAMISWM